MLSDYGIGLRRAPVQLALVRRPVIALLLLSGLTFFIGLGRPAISDSDEGFYAEASREMVEGGDWLTPHFNYEDRWQKPILYYWTTAAAFLLGGPNEFAARASAAVSGIGLVLVTWASARRLTQRDEGAWIAGAIVATCYGCFAMARSALPDLPLAFFITATIAAALNAGDADEGSRGQWWMLTGLSAGLGFLTKGPLGVIVPAIVLGPIWWRERRTLNVRLAHLAAAAAVFAVSGLPWYIAMTAAHGSAYVNSFFVGDNLERFATTRFNGPREIWFYVPIVIGGLLPWSAFLLVLPSTTVRDLVRRRRRLSNVEWRLLLWTLMPLLLFTASVGKQPRYILPILPPLAIMVGMALAHRVSDAARERQPALSIATFATSALFLMMAALLYRARTLFLSAYPAITMVGLMAVAGAGIALAALAAARAWTRLPGAMAATAAVLLLTLQFGALAGIRPEAVEEMAALIRQNRLQGERVGEYQAFVRNLAFYTGFRHVQVQDDAGALAFLESPDRVFLVVSRPDLERLQPLTHAPVRTLGVVTSLDDGSVRVGTLLDPQAEEVVQTVVLVTNR
jgi:4-amino-4-deoxy-L-arabinose transferase-like glycosyltransferase